MNNITNKIYVDVNDKLYFTEERSSSEYNKIEKHFQQLQYKKQFLNICANPSLYNEQQLTKQELELHMLLCGNDIDFIVDDLYNNRSPFLISVFNYNIKLIHFLLRIGADINFQDNDGNTALHYACDPFTIFEDKFTTRLECKRNMILLLLNNGANPKILNNNNELPHNITHFMTQLGISIV